MYVFQRSCVPTYSYNNLIIRIRHYSSKKHLNYVLKLGIQPGPDLQLKPYKLHYACTYRAHVFKDTIQIVQHGLDLRGEISAPIQGEMTRRVPVLLHVSHRRGWGWSGRQASSKSTPASSATLAAAPRSRTSRLSARGCRHPTPLPRTVFSDAPQHDRAARSRMTRKSRRTRYNRPTAPPSSKSHHRTHGMGLLGAMAGV